MRYLADKVLSMLISIFTCVSLLSSSVVTPVAAEDNYYQEDRHNQTAMQQIEEKLATWSPFVTAHAEDTDTGESTEVTTVASGTWGTCPWTLDSNGVLTIGAGTGENIPSDTQQGPWYQYRTKIKSVKTTGTVVLPASSAYLFASCSSLTNLDLKSFDTSKVTDMSYMFIGCNALASLDASSWDTSKVTDMRRMFYACRKLTSLDASKWDTSEVTSMFSTFDGCSSLTSLDVSSWDTSKVTDMHQMFAGCSKLTNLDVSDWDTSKVTNMFNTFSGCSGLTNLDVSKWDTSNVTNMESLFYGCSKLTSLDVSNWVTSNVTDMDGMFYGCSSLTSLDLGNWNASKVTTMEGMFRNCTSLTNLNTSNWKTDSAENMGLMFYNCKKLASLDVSGWNTDNVKNMSFMFYECSSLVNLDVSKWHTSKVTSMYRMFEGCSSLTNLDANNWDTSNVTNMYQMFYNCSSLTSLDISNWDTGKVTNMHYMFDACSKLTSLDLGNWNTSNVTDMFAMFSGCSNLASLDVSGWDTSKVSDMSHMFFCCSSLADLDMSGWNMSKVTTMFNMFSGCSSLTNLDASKWNTSNVTTMESMFAACSKLTSLDAAKWDTSNVTNMDGMFYGGSKLASLDVSGWNTSNVTTMYSMFDGCSSLTKLDAGNWNTGNVTEMGFMFRGCSSLTNLDASKWNTSKVKGMFAMFEGCSSLTNLDVSKWDTSNVTLMESMFAGCNKLTRLETGNWNTSQMTDLNDMFEGCSSLTSLDVSKWDTSNVTEMSGMLEDCSNLTKITFGNKFATPEGVIYIFPEPAKTASGAPSNGTWGKGSETNGDPIKTAVELATYGATAGNLTGTWYAQAAPTYTLTYNGNGGTPSKESQTAVQGKAWGTLATATKTGYTFAGWYTDASGGTQVTDTTVCSDNLTVYAHWTINAADAILNPDTGEFIIVRTKDDLGDPGTIIENGSVTSLAGVTYTGTVYVDVEKGATWSAKMADIKSVKVLDQIRPSNLDRWFQNAINCTEMDVANIDPSGATYMGSMFKGCTSLESIDLHTWNVGTIANAGSMFSGCTSLKSVNISGWNLPKSRSPYLMGMFENCSSLQSIDLSSLDLSTAYMGGMFKGCTSLVKFKISDKFNAPRYEDMFPTPTMTESGASSIGTWGKDSEHAKHYYSASHSGKAGYLNDNLSAGTWYAQAAPLDGWAYAVLDSATGEMDFIRSTEVIANGTAGSITSSVSNTTYTGTIFADFEQNHYTYPNAPWVNNYSSIKTIKVIDPIHPASTAYWFHHLVNMTSVDLSNLDTSETTDMNNMFANCSGLTDIDASALTTANVTDMHDMFSNCKALTSADLSGMDTRNVSNMNNMFSSDTALVTFKVSDRFIIPSSAYSVFPYPARTASGKSSDHSWGLNSENADESYMPTDLCKAIKGGTWYAQAGYAIGYNLNGGSIVTGTNPTTYKKTSPNITLINPSKSGYTFAGWTGTDLSSKTITVIIPKGSTGDRFYTANWLENHYTVNFYSNDGTDTVTRKTVAYTEAFDLPSVKRIDYDLIGWSTTANATTAEYQSGATVSKLTDVDNNTIDLYAIWKPAETHVSGSISWKNDTEANRPAAATLHLYHNGIDTGDSVSTDASQNWAFDFGTKAGNSYTIIEDPVGDIYKTTYEYGTGAASFTVINEATLTDVSGVVQFSNDIASARPESVTLHLYHNGTDTGESVITDASQNWRFSFGQRQGWNYSIVEDPINGYDTTCAEHDNLANGIDSNFNYDDVKLQLTFSADTKTNTYTYVNIYYKNKNGTFTQLGDGSYGQKIVSGTKVIVPYQDIYVEIDRNKNWQGFYEYFGFSISDISVVNGASLSRGATLSSFSPEKSTIELMEDNWPESSHPYDGETYMWHYIPSALYHFVITNDFKGTVISFNKNGGSGTVPNSVAVIAGQELPALSSYSLARKGYTFNGFDDYYDASGKPTKKWDQTVRTATLKANWRINKETIQYHANGGIRDGKIADLLDSLSINYGASISLPAKNEIKHAYKLTKENFVLTGWNTAADGSGTHYDLGAKFTNRNPIDDATVALYAEWTPNTPTEVYFMVNSEPAVHNRTMGVQTINPGAAKALKTCTYQWQGHTFTGWNTKADGTGTAYKDGAIVTGNGNPSLVLYAQWAEGSANTAKTYTIHVDTNGGTFANDTGYDAEIVVSKYSSRPFVTTSFSPNMEIPEINKAGFYYTSFNTAADGTGEQFNYSSIANRRSDMASTLDAAKYSLTAALISYMSGQGINEMTIYPTWEHDKVVHFQTGNPELQYADIVYHPYDSYLDYYGKHYGPDYQIIGDDDNITLPNIETDNDGHCFTGWRKVGADSSVSPISGTSKISYLFSSNEYEVTLEPVWSTDAKTSSYIIKFDAAGGEGSLSDMEIPLDANGNMLSSNYQLVLPLDAFTQTGKWYPYMTADINGTQKTYPCDTTYPNAAQLLYQDMKNAGISQITLSPQWLDDLTISYDMNGVDDITIPDYTYHLSSEEIDNPPTMTIPSVHHGKQMVDEWTVDYMYVRHEFMPFLGKFIPGDKVSTQWFYMGLSKFAPEDTSSHYTMTAHWSDMYTVHFDANGGYGAMDDIYLSGDTTKILSTGTVQNIFTKDRSVFIGWSLTPKYSGAADTSNSISLLTSVNAEDDSTLITPVNGSETISSGMLKSYADDNNEVTLYAQWSEDNNAWSEVAESSAVISNISVGDDGNITNTFSDESQLSTASIINTLLTTLPTTGGEGLLKLMLVAVSSLIAGLWIDKRRKAKIAKGLMAMLVAAALVLPNVNQPIHAEETHDPVTVYNVNDEGVTVTLHQIVDGVYRDDGKFVRYELVDSVNGAIADAGFNPTAEEITAIADHIETGVFADRADGVITMTADESVPGKYTANVEPGLYIVMVSGGNGSVYNPAVVAMNITDANLLTTEAGTVDMSQYFKDVADTAYLKSSPVALVHHIITADQITLPYDDAGTSETAITKYLTSKDIESGKDVMFAIDYIVPSYSADYAKPKVVVSEIPEAGKFTTAKDIAVYSLVDGKYVAVAADTYTLANNADGGFTITMNPEVNKDPQSMRIVYTTSLSDDCDTNFNENINTARMQYSVNASDSSDEKLAVKNSYAYLYSFGVGTPLDDGSDQNLMDIFKISQNKTPDGADIKLAGAEFTLYSDPEMKVPVRTYTTEADGRIIFKGLDAGKYYLKETMAPQGYTLAETEYRLDIETEYDDTTGALSNCIMHLYVADRSGLLHPRSSVTTTASTTGGSGSIHR